MAGHAAPWSRTVETPEGPVTVSGRVAPGFEAAAEAVCDNFTERAEAGAAVHAQHRGREVVSLSGGRIASPADTAYRSSSDDTICVIFSATKPATALCMHLLTRRGQVDLDAPVSAVWPAFAAQGKEQITLRMVLDHSAGIPILSEPLKTDCLCDHGYMADRLAAATPVFAPGRTTAYHPVTGGFILAEVLRRVDGRSLGRFFAEEIAEPLGLDFWIGLPDALEQRVAHIRHFVPQNGGGSTPFGKALRDPASPQNRFFFNHGDWMAKGVNTQAGRRAEIGAGLSIVAMMLQVTADGARAGPSLPDTKRKTDHDDVARDAAAGRADDARRIVDPGDHGLRRGRPRRRADRFRNRRRRPAGLQPA